MKIDLKKITSVLTHISKEHLVGYAMLFLAILFIAAIAGDVLIFFSYYRISVEPAFPAPVSQLEVSQQNLDEALKIIKGQ